MATSRSRGVCGEVRAGVSVGPLTPEVERLSLLLSLLVGILIDPLFAEFQAVILSGSLGFKGDAIEGLDKDRPCLGVRINTALRAPPV
jgi:hypothetical protein